MFIVLTLGLVVLTHLMQIAVAMMAVAAVWGVALLATRPRATRPHAAQPAPLRAAEPSVSAFVERNLHTARIRPAMNRPDTARCRG
jgi:hypothetical protein